MIRAVRTRLGILTVLAAGSLALGCGSDGGGKGGAGAGGNKGLPDGEESLAITFSPMYSAFDGKHTFKVPVVVLDAPAKITFRALDEGMVDVVRTGDASAMLTMRKAGKTTIVGEADDGTWAKAELTVTEAAPNLYDLGRERYENGVEAFTTPEGGFMIPDFADSGIMFVDGGIVFPDGGFPRFDAGAFMANPESACTFCHKPDGAGSGGGGLLNIDVEHTPQQIGGYSDDDLLKIFTEGMKPPGVPMRIANTPRLEMTWKMTHQWQMEEEAKKGIIVYIRGLEPKTQGPVDFLGGLTRGDGGFMLPPGLIDLLRDGGLNLGGLFGDGGFSFGNRDSGAPPAPPADTGTPDETESDAGEAMDAGAGSDSGT
jgi:hypothetical protein